MCGIVGAFAKQTRRFLLRGLSRLEYRGYDSAGVAFVNGKGINRIAVAGRIGALRARVKTADAAIGIGHTRWATHGAPTENNAHPVVVEQVAIVHNGIIENYAHLKNELINGGCVFHTDTDTEVIACLLDLYLAENNHLHAALQNTISRLEGAFAIAAIARGHEEIVFARRGAPLMVGDDDNNIYLASDALALQGVCRRVAYLEENDSGILSANGAQLFDGDGKAIKRAWHALSSDVSVASLGEHRHFMQKEIFEQPFSAVSATNPYIKDGQIMLRAFGRGATTAFRRAQHTLIIACGTSYHAAMVARYWMQEFGLPCRVEIASEYRYLRDPQAAKTLAIAVSQSGETADTLSALQTAQAHGAQTLAISNVAMSPIIRCANFSMQTNAGPEIGVASSKSFTAQLAQLLILTLAIAKAKQTLSPAIESEVVEQLSHLPHILRRTLLLEKQIQQWARHFAAASSALFVGRYTHYPLALEGALKLKEISYVHAEGCAAGELKHGLLALVDKTMPVLGMMPNNHTAPKIASNLSEIAARGGRLFILSSDNISSDNIAIDNANLLTVNDGGQWISPIVYAVPLQLLAYYTALEKGTDIDKPRNLAKSVTVE